MKKSDRFVLSIVLLVSLVVAFFLWQDLRASRADLSSLKATLEESTASWNRINDEKLILQAQLNEASEALREAEMTYTESKDKITGLEEDIKSLNAEIESLTAEIQSLEANALSPDPETQSPGESRN